MEVVLGVVEEEELMLVDDWVVVLVALDASVVLDGCDVVLEDCWVLPV